MLGLSMDAGDSLEFFDKEAFPNFSEPLGKENRRASKSEANRRLLSASEGYARYSGCRFRKSSFESLETQSVGGELEGKALAKAEAAPLIKAFMEKVQGQRDEALKVELNEAFNILWSESMRSAMVARHVQTLPKERACEFRWAFHIIIICDESTTP